MITQEILKYPFVLLVGLLATYLLTPLVRTAATKIGIVDMPGKRRLNTVPVPRGGGLAVFLGFHLACAAVFLMPWAPFRSSLNVEWWLRFLLVSSALLGLGLLDDVLDLRWWMKLAGQAGVAVLAFWLDMRVGRILYFELPPWVDLAVTVIWIVGIINAFNLIDGLDGLSAGLAIIASSALFCALVLRRLPGDALIVLALIGPCLAFLRYNFHPASIFLGDAGSMFLGLTLATLAIASSSKGTVTASLGIALLAIGVPVFDMFLAVWRRLVRGFASGEKFAGVMRVDSDHLHHRLLRLGLTQPRAVMGLYAINAALVAVGLLSILYHSRALGIFLAAFIAAAYIIVRHLARVELWESGTAILKGFRRPVPKVAVVICYPVADVLLMSVALVCAIALTCAGGADFRDIRNEYVRIAPVWLGVPFLFMVAARTYARVWSRARIAEFVILDLAVLGGSLTVLAVMILAGQAWSRSLLERTVLYGSMVILFVTSTRTFFGAVRDCMAAAARRLGHETRPVRRVLVCGAGPAGVLYLHGESYRPPDELTLRHVVGLMDDDTNLHNRLVYGHKVLGGTRDVARVIEEYRVDEIVLTAPLEEAARRRVLEVARQHGVRVRESRTELVEVSGE